MQQRKKSEVDFCVLFLVFVPVPVFLFLLSPHPWQPPPPKVSIYSVIPTEEIMRFSATLSHVKEEECLSAAGVGAEEETGQGDQQDVAE